MNNTKRCGLIMPISEFDGCSEEHWKDVKKILEDVVSEIGLELNMVSEAKEVDVIHKRIVHNLYDNPIVICDVSGGNPNVMVELGIRLAFDKPTIIIIDDKTDFIFDTGVIEHVPYPRSLRHSLIEDFKKRLKVKIMATIDKANEDENYSPFLKHFSRIKPTINETTVSSERYIVNMLNSINSKIEDIQPTVTYKTGTVSIDVSDVDDNIDFHHIDISHTQDFRTFLDDVYFRVASYVKPYTYAFDWLLFDKFSGKPFDLSDQTIRKNEVFLDDRTLEEVGIYPSSQLKLILLKKEKVEEEATV